jgi:maltose O-acetyltransferase
MISIMKNITVLISGWKTSLAWFITNKLLCKLPSNRLRKMGLQIMGSKIGKFVYIFSNFHIRSPKNLKIGKGCSIGPNVLLDARKGIILGENVTLAYDSIIWTLNHDYNDVNFKVKGGQVKIGNFAWICSRSIILPGVEIGEGAVIASGSVVTKNVGPYEIWGGIPAKQIGIREKKEYNYVPGSINLHIV